MINITIYEDKYFFYIWKFQGIPTTFGKRKSFLDFLIENIDFIKLINKNFYYHIKNNSIENEFLLLNRLDNDTGGLLYFAKNMDIFNKFKYYQSIGKVKKIYLVDVFGNISKSIRINFSIMHHRFLNDKMIVVKKDKDLSKGRGKLHNVETIFYPLYFDKKNGYTTGYAIITKGIRHQIRVHLASIGHPVVGDKIYSKHPMDDKLHLRSIGLKID